MSILLKCPLCNNSSLQEFCNFGDTALAGGFLRLDQIPLEKKYPMRLGFCKSCYGTQIIDHINPDILFKSYFYYSSNIKTLCDHFEGLASEIFSRFIQDNEDDVVLEFGCNDGVLLNPLARKGIKKIIGVDPAKNVVKKIDNLKIKVYNNYLNRFTSKKILKDFGKVKVILANNVFAHISEIKETTICVSSLLDDDGIFIFEVHYLGKLIEEMQYDFVYHEHIYYHSLISLTKFLASHNLIIFDLKFLDIHAGSIRVYATKKNSKYSKNITKTVEHVKKSEREKGYHKIETFEKFGEKVYKHSNALIKLLNEIKSKNKEVYGYGASGRANTVLQLSKINSDIIPFMIDDAKEKWGFFTPGSHIPIISNKVLTTKNAPEYVLLFAWSFIKEILKKNKTFLKRGGKFIIPLPNIKILDDKSFEEYL